MIKRLLLIAATVASIAVPTVEAQARSPEDRYDRREDRRDRREDRRDSRHNGGPRDRIEDRYDRREDRRDRREDRWDRNHRDWWRGRSEFRGYNGRRNGYYYAPGYGYYRSDPRYHNRRWSRGAYLPQSYRRYYVQDPYFYNLRPAPYGYRWVYVDNDLVLVSIATGLILDVLLDVY
jgi:Ni/Co efflux regulator RcnB